MVSMRVFASWSGGKDSCLALHRALRAGSDVVCLLTILDEGGLRSRGHGLGREVLDAQAQALGLPIVYGRASWSSYEAEFKRALKQLKTRGVEGGVFGDINLQGHRDWVEKVCAEVGLRAFEPLWGESYRPLLNEFMGSGFEAMIVSVKTDLVGEGWVGRRLDWKFIDHLGSRGLDLCGENGEYHTLVTYGPPFKQRIEILEGRKSVRDGWEALEVSRFCLL